jgi:hypothetical protein
LFVSKILDFASIPQIRFSVALMEIVVYVGAPVWTSDLYEQVHKTQNSNLDRKSEIGNDD